MDLVKEEARDIPVIHEADICVLGGSCTGVFAAIRAARLGAKVALVERSNCFGGVATLSLVCAWHSLWDTLGEKKIISGLTEETIDALEARGTLKRFKRTDPSFGCTFNPEDLKLVLDRMVLAEKNIKVFLHTAFAAPWINDGRLEAVIVENKSGRSAIRAKAFVDATGDGDLAARIGCRTYYSGQIQPATTCAVFSGWESLNLNGNDLHNLMLSEAGEHEIPEGFSWGCYVPGSKNFMLAATRIYGSDPSNADDMTHIEFEGRRQIAAIMEILKKKFPDSQLSLAALPARAGLRESRHIRCSYQLTGNDVLHGRKFDDAIANGSYRADVHHQDKPGITLRYLDGREEYHRPGHPSEIRRWRPTQEVDPTFYQIPFSCMTIRNCDNLVVAGRMIDTDDIAHAAVRVMVNLNQVGEAAGVAATLSLNHGANLYQTDIPSLRKTLADGGSIIL